MTLVLPREQRAFVERLVRARRFKSQSEVVREGLRRLQRDEEDDLHPQPITRAEARRVYRRDAAWERVEREVAGRAKPEV